MVTLPRTFLSLTLFLAASLVAIGSGAAPPRKGVLAARAGFFTLPAPSNYEKLGPAGPPADARFEVVRYKSGASKLAAYLTRDPGDGEKHPAVLWAHSGFGGIGSVTLAQVEPLVSAGLVVMCPSWRGENENPGRYEMFYGEVDDALAALDHLAALPWVDPSRIYVVGHSTGGTIALLVAESTDRPRAVFSFGGAPDVARVVAAGGWEDATPPFPVARAREADLRSPARFVGEIRVPTFHVEGTRAPFYLEDARKMQVEALDRGVIFRAVTISGADHLSVVQPLLGLLARSMLAGSTTLGPGEAQAAFNASRPIVVLRHPPMGFELSVRAEGAPVCELLPAGREDPIGCADLDPEAGRAALAATAAPIAGDALVRFDDWTAEVQAIEVRTEAAFTFESAEAREGFVVGLGKGVAKNAKAKRVVSHGEMQVGGRTAMRVVVEMSPEPDSQEDGFDRDIIYAMPSEGGLMTVHFLGGSAHLADLQTFADRAIATARVRPPEATTGTSDGDRAYRLGRVVGQVLFYVLWGLGALVTYLVVRSRQKKA
jgi:dienelactone hydrolase